MANKTFDELTAASTLDGTEILPLDQGGTTKRATTQSIADLSGNITRLSGLTLSTAGTTTVTAFNTSRTITVSGTGTRNYILSNTGAENGDMIEIKVITEAHASNVPVFKVWTHEGGSLLAEIDGDTVRGEMDAVFRHNGASWELALGGISAFDGTGGASDDVPSYVGTPASITIQDQSPGTGAVGDVYELANVGTWTHSPTSYTGTWQKSPNGTTGWADTTDIDITIVTPPSGVVETTIDESGVYYRLSLVATNSEGDSEAAFSNVMGPTT